ncbi:MAG TPA: hypothetical protein ENN40_10655 [Candidatus Aminicenantes bacterium]|nr:hypothetical protein [Candidatus Aminicenantes bacterium]
MQRAIIYPMLVLLLCIPLLMQATGADKEYYAHYLTPQDVEKITELSGITTNHNYSLHFLDSRGREILIVRFGPEKQFARETRREKYWTPIEGVADQAKLAIPQMPYQIAFLKGPHFAMVISMTDAETAKTFLSVDQLKAIANLIASRMDPDKPL